MHKDEFNFLMKNHKIEKGDDFIKIYLNIKEIPNSFIIISNDNKILTFSPNNLIIPPFSINIINEIELRNTKKIYKIEAIELPPIINIEGNIEYACEKIGIGFLILKKPYMEIQCNYCLKIDTINKNQICKKCNKELKYKFIPKYEKTFGFLESNFKLISFLKSIYQFNCLKCGEFYETQLDETLKEKCYNCLNNFYIKIIYIKLKSEKELFKLIPGKNLPEKGTCKHYKKSYRWFKFQCCNRMFPCDICHNENSNHPNAIANKMICGFCSILQSCKNECNCFKNNSNKFWNNGKGTRDKIKLNKKDSKKYKK